MSTGCHCLCGLAHRDTMGICQGEANTTRWLDSRTVGLVEVPMCAECARAYDKRSLPTHD
jgi:hypothetical protein